jgi:chromate reductase
MPDATIRRKVRVLIFAAALRAGSLNRKLAGIVSERLAARGAGVDHADFREFEMPMYDGDLEVASGLPEGARRLIDRIRAVDAFAISSPEYNFSIPGTLKNAIDWTSRARPIVWTGKPGLILTASPSMVGGQRSAWSLRVPLEALGAVLYPDMFSLAQADQKFDADGRLQDEKLSKRLDTVLDRFVEFAGKLTGN